MLNKFFNNAPPKWQPEPNDTRGRNVISCSVRTEMSWRRSSGIIIIRGGNWKDDNAEGAYLYVVQWSIFVDVVEQIRLHLLDEFRNVKRRISQNN